MSVILVLGKLGFIVNPCLKIKQNKKERKEKRNKEKKEKKREKKDATEIESFQVSAVNWI